MESQDYTQLERGSIFEALEVRLSTRQSFLDGPQIQLFRVSSPPNVGTISRMPGMATQEEPRRATIPEIASNAKSREDLIQAYTKRIQVMQAIINQLRATIKERQLWADDAKTARKELEEARLKIAGLEDRLEHGGSTRRRNATEKDGTAFKESERAEVIEGTSEGNKKFDQVDEGLTGQRTNSEPSAQVIQGRSINDLVKIHHVAWGSESIHDESLHLQLMEYAAKGADFTPTGNFVGRDTGPDERKTLVVAYSSPLEAPLRWLILDEGHRGKFSL